MVRFNREICFVIQLCCYLFLFDKQRDVGFVTGCSKKKTYKIKFFTTSFYNGKFVQRQQNFVKRQGFRQYRQDVMEYLINVVLKKKKKKKKKDRKSTRLNSSPEVPSRMPSFS
eukprot:TRINITY_DN6930_c0_g1_i1.p3 TRINITY_DN6930_c0_g1~~TRINITY_DN6930_c0_g1_i1.p3  ORF type:complete len:113 (-),score=5.90 TRINITY_DN6930_c0_g1_i1:11-349(-)